MAYSVFIHVGQLPGVSAIASRSTPALADLIAADASLKRSAYWVARFL